jgi:hypothetical protein
MTPSEKTKITTDGQITKAVANYRALLEKHAKEFNSKAVQAVLGQLEFADEVFTLFRKRVEAVSNLLIRCVKVNRNQKPQEAINATGRVQYVDNDVVASMPHGEGEDAEVVFFNLGRFINDNDLEKEYELRGLKPADPYSLAKVNEDDPSFADTKPNATHWKDSSGKWCYIAFSRWSDDGRNVHVDRDDGYWNGYWWFAGLRK